MKETLERFNKKKYKYLYKTTLGGVLSHPMYGVDNYMTKSVGCYLLNGKFHKYYKCYQDAENELNISAKNISSSVNKKFATNGFVFIHQKDGIYPESIEPHNKRRGINRRKKIQLLNLMTDELIELPSTKILQETIGMPKASYDYHIKKKHKEFIYKEQWKVFIL